MYKNYTVLFVDDELNILKSIKRLMLGEDFTSVFALSGQEALEIVSQNKISVIVTDMRMPEMNGLELLNKIEEISPLTVKLVLSGYTQIPQIIATVNQVDIYKFILKPWDGDELISAVKKSLDYYIIKEEYSKHKIILETQNKAYKNILGKINSVVKDAKNSNQIICSCGKQIVNFGRDFTFIERETFRDVFEIQNNLLELLSNGISFENTRINLNIIVQNLSNVIIPIIPNAKIRSTSDLTTIFDINMKIFEIAIAVAALIFNKEFRSNGLIISVEHKNDLAISMICAEINDNKELENNAKLVIDAKSAFLQGFTNELLRLSNIELTQSVVNDTLAIKFRTISERQEEK